MVEKNKGEAPDNETKKKRNTDTIQQGFGIFNQYIDRQVHKDDGIKEMQKRKEIHRAIIVNSKKKFKSTTVFPAVFPIDFFILMVTVNVGWEAR